MTDFSYVESLIRQTRTNEKEWIQKGRLFDGIKSKVIYTSGSDRLEVIRDFNRDGKLSTKCYIYCDNKLISVKNNNKVSELIKAIQMNIASNDLENQKKQIINEKELWKIYSPLPGKSIVIRGNNFYCYKNHNTKEIGAVFNAINKRGEVTQKIVPAGYCAECGLYFISNSVYHDIKKDGIILRQVLDRKTYENTRDSFSWSYDNLKPESLLHQFGYTVARDSFLSDGQRQAILLYVINAKIMSRIEVIDFLDFCIFSHSSLGHYEAISTWEEDRKFVRNLVNRDIETHFFDVVIGKLKVKQNITRMLSDINRRE